MGRFSVPKSDELQFKGKRPVKLPGIVWFSQIPDYIKKRGKKCPPTN
jgi:hypothetical protein